MSTIEIPFSPDGVRGPGTASAASAEKASTGDLAGIARTRNRGNAVGRSQKAGNGPEAGRTEAGWRRARGAAAPAVARVSPCRAPRRSRHVRRSGAAGTITTRFVLGMAEAPANMIRRSAASSGWGPSHIGCGSVMRWLSDETPITSSKARQASTRRIGATMTITGIGSGIKTERSRPPRDAPSLTALSSLS